MTQPKVNSASQRELLKAEDQIKDFEAQVKAITPDVVGQLPVQETEQQTKLSTKQIDKEDGYFLKPSKSVSCKEPFNERHREDYDFFKERVRFIAENNEVIGSTIEIWTKPFSGIAAEYWEVPVNKVVIGPRYLAEQIARKSYTRLMMDEHKVSGYEGSATMLGQFVGTHKIQRIVARPAAGFNKRASSF